MRTSSTLDRAADQLVDGATETADLVAETLAEVAHSAIDVAADVIGDTGDALAALSIGHATRRLRQPRTLLVALVLALAGVWLYRRFTEGEDDGHDHAG